MKTKVTVLGLKPVKELKAIEFENSLTDSVQPTNRTPDMFLNIELISRDYITTGTDLMFAYNTDRNDPDACLYLGHFNDGIV